MALALVVIAGLALLATACSGGGSDDGLSGTIQIDGSSTVYPVTQAVAEEFSREHRNVRVPVGVSGTGGGMEKFTAGETVITNASREISEEEAAAAAENGIEFTRFAVARDGITVVVHPDNDWVEDITVEDLQQIWAPDSDVTTWSDVRPEWPDEDIELYGPGSDSGTFDYFTGAVVGEAGASRSDYTASEDDNVLVNGVSGSEYALGYFGYAYYAENTDKVKALAVEGLVPTPATIGSGEYTPLSRPLFIYVRNEAVQRAEIEAFLRFYFNNASELVPQVGYVPLESYEDQLEKVDGLR